MQCGIYFIDELSEYRAVLARHDQACEIKKRFNTPSYLWYALAAESAVGAGAGLALRYQYPLFVPRGLIPRPSGRLIRYYTPSALPY
jgi:hypothetical protein